MATEEKKIPLVIDCFMYNGEPVVEFRLKYLYPLVDHFVVVESQTTHSGKIKPRLFTERFAHVFQPYMDKVIIHVLNGLPSEHDNTNPIIKRILSSKHSFRIHEPAWLREAYQRDAVQDFLLTTFSNRPFMVIVCDADEIPSERVVSKLSTVYDQCHQGVHFQMVFLRYNFLWKEPTLWSHPFVITDQGTRDQSFSDVRLHVQKQIEHSGWHLSYFLTPNDMVRKLESFAHTEYDLPKYKSKEYIKTCMLTGRYLFDKKHKLVLTEEKELPDGWRELQNEINEKVFQEENEM